MIATSEQIAVSRTGDGLQDTTDPLYEYHSDFSRLSASMLKVWMKSRREFEAIYVTKVKEPQPATKIMDFGSVIHAVFLEGKKLDDVVMQYPSFCLNKNGGLIGAQADTVNDVCQRFASGEPLSEIVKAYPSDCITKGGNLSPKKAEEFRKESGSDCVYLMQEQADELFAAIDGRTTAPEFLLKSDDIERAKTVVGKIVEHPAYQWISHEKALTEETIHWHHEPSGLDCRSRLDVIIPLPRFSFILDLKMSAHWHPDDFPIYMGGNRRGSQRGWVQSAFYATAVAYKFQKPATMKFLAVNPEVPFQTVLHTMGEQAFDEAQRKMDHEMVELAKAMETGDFADPFETRDNIVTLSEWELV